MTTTATDAAHSPWWYRRRGTVIAFIYFLGFALGALLWSKPGTPYLPFFVWAGEAFGSSGPVTLLWIATLLVVACWALRVWGSSYLSARVVWNPDARTDALLVDGPFRYVRNPLYLGNLLMALGIGALATPCGFGLIVLANAIFLHLLADYESRGLRARYAAAYDAYARAVPALIPRPTPARVEGTIGGTASLKQGLRAEIFSAAMALAMIYLLAGGPYALHVFLFLYIAGWVLQRVVTRPSASSG